MNKKIISASIFLTLFFTTICPVHLVYAQQMPVNDLGGNSYQIHPDAVPGSTSARQQAWDGLTTQEQDQAVQELQQIIQQEQYQSSSPYSENDTNEKDTTISFVNFWGTENQLTLHQESINPQAPLENPGNSFDSFASPQYQSRPVDPCPDCEPEPPFPTPTPTPNPTPTPTPTPGDDSDLDGLSDTFENSLADGFTPYYHVSGGEMAGTGFATFYNSVPQTVNQVFGPTPPISHYRVKPLRFEYGSDGQQYGLIQLDYLTLWNRDDGLQIGGVCTNALTVGFGLAGYSLSQFLAGLQSHNLDNERSAMLVAAPVVAPNTFNTNLSSYKAYRFFTAAHEGTPADKSLLFSYYQPLDFGWHPQFAFSRGKHATYPGNPNNLRLIPNYVIYSAYATLSYFYYSGRINYIKYLASLYLLDVAFFACVVEDFQEQGGVFSGTKINVGELNHPINGSMFIQDTQLSNKLNRLF